MDPVADNFHQTDSEEEGSDSESFEDALEQMSLQCQAEKKKETDDVTKPKDEATPFVDNLENPQHLDNLENSDDFCDAAKDLDEEEDEDEKEEEEEDDEEALKLRDDKLTPEEIEEFHKSALRIKLEANEVFKRGEYETAIEKYTEALLTCPLCHSEDRSVLYSNRAACHMRMEKYEKSIKDSTKAVELKPTYVKALLRRAELYEKTEKLDEALADYQQLLQLDPSLGVARQACVRLPDEIKVRNEKMKDEMMGKLKDLGNLVLRPFGLSTDNFNLQQDPNTGGYSVQFSQAQGNGK